MIHRISVYEFVGLPAELGYTLLAFTFILLLSPYLAGADFGIFKVPTLSSLSRRVLQWLGPVLFGVALLLLVPTLSANPIEQVPDLSGAWARRTNPPVGLRIVLAQTGKHLTSSVT